MVKYKLMKKLPKYLKKYFWDTDFEEIDFKDRKIYILKRILEYGDVEAAAWMRKNFKRIEIKNVLCNFRGYSLKSANFWAFILNIKKEDVRCLSRSFRETQKQFWAY